MSGAALADTAHAGLDRPPIAGGAGRLAAAWRVIAVGLGMFVVAAAVRLFALDAYVTIDESRWVQRASDFSAYVDQGRPEETFIIGHPGVTTMWTALLGMGPERARRFSFLEGREDATRREGYFDALIAARRTFALVGALGVAAVALLGWRLLGAGPALVGGMLLAFEPFLIAHARVTHLDSGLTTYTAVAALAALVFFAAGGSWPYLVLSGAATGLAFLTKAPSIYLLAFVPLAAGVSWLASDRRPAGLPRLAGLLVAWGLVAALVGALLWPSLRVDPIGTLLQMARFTERVGGGEHDNFFLGSATDDPGPFFYPFALVIRLAPVTFAGLLLVAVAWRRLSTARRTVVGLLLLYALGFVAMMTLGPKKFDRYLLPLYPILGLLAGLGLWNMATMLHGRAVAKGAPASSAPTRLAGAGAAVLAAVVVLQAATLLPVVRYPLAYYSPLLGGGRFAEDLILVGWGEGLDQVAVWIDAQPRPLGEPTVATSYHRVLQAQLTGSAVPLEHVRMADYVVPYVNTLQRGDEAHVLGPYLGASTPEHTVRINGIEYARVYRGPHYPVATELWLTFGDRVTLIRDVTAPGSGDVRFGEEVTVGLRWDRAPAAEERVIVAILGADGRPVVQDERRVGEDGPDERGQPGDLHRLTVPARTPAGSYRLAIRVLDGRSRSPLPASGNAAGGGVGRPPRSRGDAVPVTATASAPASDPERRPAMQDSLLGGPEARGRAGWRVPAVALAAVAVLALVVRLWGLGWQLPWQFHPDEGHYTWKALDLMSQETLNPKYFRNPSLFTYVLLAEYKLLGFQPPKSDEQAATADGLFRPPSGVAYVGRLTSALLGVLNVLAIGWIGWRALGPWTGVLGALFLALAFIHVRDSHYATNDVPSVLLMTLSVGASLSLLRGPRLSAYLLAGLFGGLATSTKYSAGLFVVPLLVAHGVVVWRAWKSPSPGLSPSQGAVGTSAQPMFAPRSGGAPW